MDNSLILQSQQDETTILPIGISRSLKVALQLAQSSTPPDDPSRNVLVSEAFLRTFVEVCGHYQTHIVVQQDGKKVFEVSLIHQIKNVLHLVKIYSHFVILSFFRGNRSLKLYVLVVFRCFWSGLLKLLCFLHLLILVWIR